MSYLMFYLMFCSEIFNIYYLSNYLGTFFVEVSPIYQIARYLGLFGRTRRASVAVLSFMKYKETK